MLELRKTEGHCIPHLGLFLFTKMFYFLLVLTLSFKIALYLRNLTFMEDGNTDFLFGLNDFVNIGKLALIARTIDEIDAMKKLGYVDIIEPDFPITNLILNAKRLDNPEEQYQHSLSCEARQKSLSVAKELSVPSRIGSKRAKKPRILQEASPIFRASTLPG